MNRARLGERSCGLQPAIRWGIPKSVGTHSVTSCTLDGSHVAAGFNVCTAGFWFCFVSIPNFYGLILSFWNENVYSVPLYLGSL
jgi:hypothetical protein